MTPSYVAVDLQTEKVCSLANDQELGNSVSDRVNVNVNNIESFLNQMQVVLEQHMKKTKKIFHLRSKALITVIFLIGVLLALNTLIFTVQTANTNSLCSINDFILPDKELTLIMRPVSFYCNVQSFFVLTNVFLLLLCLVALTFAFMRYKGFFLFSYTILLFSFIFGVVFFLSFLIMDYQKIIFSAVTEMLDWEITHNRNFCQMFLPHLKCQITNHNVPSRLVYLAELQTGIRSKNLLDLVCERTQWTYSSRMNGPIPGFGKALQECTDYLTSFCIGRSWLIFLMFEYAFVVVAGCYVTLRSMLFTDIPTVVIKDGGNTTANSDQTQIGCHSEQFCSQILEKEAQFVNTVLIDKQCQ